MGRDIVTRLRESVIFVKTDVLTLREKESERERGREKEADLENITRR